MPGPRIERFDLGDHLGEILGIDPADPHQRRDVARREQRQIVEETLHRRVEPVAVAQLQRQAFGEIAREDAGRIEFLQAREHALDPRRRRSRARSAAVVEIDAQIAGLVELIEQMRGDHPIGRVAKIGADLLDQMLAQACAAAPRPARWPVRCRRRGRTRPRLRHRSRARRPRSWRAVALSPAAACQCSAASPATSPIRRRAAPAASAARPAPAARPRRGRKAPRRARGSPRSSSGFCSISASTNSLSSRFDSCSILIACCSCGVMTSAGVWRSSSRCERPILFTKCSVGSGAYRLNRSPR